MLPTRLIGLKYDQGEGVPRVIVKGSGEQVEKIIREQRRLVPHKVVKNDELLKQLYRLPVDAQIGSELFELVAALLVHVYGIDQAYGDNNR